MSKYIIIKVSDVVAATHIDEQRSLHGILQKIHQFRLAAGKDANTMVAMNMTDPFARVAVSAYINAIESDQRTKDVPALQDIATEFRSVLFQTKLTKSERLPDV